MKFFRMLVMVVLILPFYELGAQEPPRPGDPRFGAEGRLVILKVVPGNRTAKLFFVGKKAAEVDFSKDHKLLSVRAFKDGQSEVLKFKNNGDSYEVLDIPQWKGSYSLGVKSEIKGTVEELNVKIQSAP